MDEQLSNSTQSAAELRARAQELRAQAEHSDIQGVREASIALAERYEEAASARLPAR